MATLPVQRTWTVGETVTAAMFNDDVRDLGNFLLNPPAALVHNAAIAVANITVTYATFTTERYDTDTIHSTSTNTGRLTCNLAGIYSITAYGSFAGSAGGSQRSVLVRLNGTTTLRQVDIPRNGAGTTTVPLAFTYKLAATDYLEMGVYQDSGGALNVTPEFGMTWLGVG